MVIKEQQRDNIRSSMVPDREVGMIGNGNDQSGSSNSTLDPSAAKVRLTSRFKVIKKLGQGTYGKVQLAVNKETGQEVAIKTIKKSKIESEQDLIRIRREISIMSSIQHPHIIRIYEVFENREKIVLVMQYASGGKLYEYVSQRKILGDAEARRLFRQISTAVYYCHKNKICHRDLKLENIFLDDKGNAKIGDFGLSNTFDESSHLNTYCGSPLYASPEIVQGTPYIGPEVDCWSMGVLLYTLVYGQMPFGGFGLDSFKMLVKQISKAQYAEPEEKSKASGLIRKLLTVDPTKRATIIDICTNKWVNEGCEHSLLQIAEDMATLSPMAQIVSTPTTPTATKSFSSNQSDLPQTQLQPQPIQQQQSVQNKKESKVTQQRKQQQQLTVPIPPPIAEETKSEATTPTQTSVNQQLEEVQLSPSSTESTMIPRPQATKEQPQSEQPRETQQEQMSSTTTSPPDSTPSSKATSPPPQPPKPTFKLPKPKPQKMSHLSSPSVTQKIQKYKQAVTSPEAKKDYNPLSPTSTIKQLETPPSELQSSVEKEISSPEKLKSPSNQTFTSEVVERPTQLSLSSTPQPPQSQQLPLTPVSQPTPSDLPSSPYDVASPSTSVECSTPTSLPDTSSSSSAYFSRKSRSIDESEQEERNIRMSMERRSSSACRRVGRLSIPNPLFEETKVPKKPVPRYGSIEDTKKQLLQRKDSIEREKERIYPTIPVHVAKEDVERRASIPEAICLISHGPMSATLNRVGPRSGRRESDDQQTSSTTSSVSSNGQVSENRPQTPKSIVTAVTLKLQQPENQKRRNNNSYSTPEPTGTTASSTAITSPEPPTPLTLTMFPMTPPILSESEVSSPEVSEIQDSRSYFVDDPSMSQTSNKDETSEETDSICSSTMMEIAPIRPVPITRSYKKTTFTKDGACVTETGKITTTTGPDGTITTIERKSKITRYPASPNGEFGEGTSREGPSSENAVASSTVTTSQISTTSTSSTIGPNHMNNSTNDSIMTMLNNGAPTGNDATGPSSSAGSLLSIINAGLSKSESVSSAGSVDIFDDVFDSWHGDSIFASMGSMVKRIRNLLPSSHNSLLTRRCSSRLPIPPSESGTTIGEPPQVEDNFLPPVPVPESSSLLEQLRAHGYKNLVKQRMMSGGCPPLEFTETVFPDGEETVRERIHRKSFYRRFNEPESNNIHSTTMTPSSSSLIHHPPSSSLHHHQRTPSESSSSRSGSVSRYSTSRQSSVNRSMFPFDP